MAQLQGAVYPVGEVVFSYFGGGVCFMKPLAIIMPKYQIMQIFLANNFKPDVKFYDCNITL